MLMPGHLLLYHPGVLKLKELIDSGELGDVLCIYGNRQNLGTIRKDENALWSLGVHDLSVILYLLGEEPAEAVGARQRVPHARASRTSSSATCASRAARSRTCTSRGSTRTRCGKITVVGRDKMAVFDDMELERKVTVYDKAPEEPSPRPTASGGRAPATSSARRSRTTSRCGSSARTSSRLVRGERRPASRRATALVVVRTLERLQDVARRRPA